MCTLQRARPTVWPCAAQRTSLFPGSPSSVISSRGLKTGTLSRPKGSSSSSSSRKSLRRHHTPGARQGASGLWGASERRDGTTRRRPTAPSEHQLGGRLRHAHYGKRRRLWPPARSSSASLLPLPLHLRLPSPVLVVVVPRVHGPVAVDHHKAHVDRVDLQGRQRMAQHLLRKPCLQSLP